MSVNASCATARPGWPLQRILFLLAGSFVLLGVVLSAAVSTWFLLLPALVALNQLLFVAVGWCPMSLLLGRVGVEDLRDRQDQSPRAAAGVR